MKNIVLKSLILLILQFSLGCSLLFHREVDLNPPNKKQMEDRIAEAEGLLEEQSYQEAFEYFGAFQKEFPQSIFDLQTNVGRARALTNLEKWSESLKILKEVTETAVSENQNKYIGIAAYYSSLNYEALGEEPQTLACLKDAEAVAEAMPLEISKAELPARLAVYYNRMGDSKEAQKYFHQAEKGVASFYQKNKELSAKNYFQMGFISTGQTSLENFQSILSTLELMQIFSLRSIEAQNKKWSPMALQNLKSNYRDVWNAIVQAPLNKTLDHFAAEEDQKESQFKSIGQLLDVIQKLRVYQRTHFEDNPVEKDLFGFLDELESNAQKMMVAISSRSSLTPDSQKRQKLKKIGKIRSEPFFPSEKGDPNLKGNSQ